MGNPWFKGFCFGLTSGIITTLGMMVGLFSGTGSKLVVIGGILSIAIADSFSDALGIHISEESSNKNHDHVWIATLSTLLFKFVFSLVFIIPVLLFELFNAILISVGLGIFGLGVLSYFLAIDRNKKPLGVILEHIVIAFVVVVVTYFVGRWVSLIF